MDYVADSNVSAEERKWAVILHIGPMAGYFLPFAGFVVPLVIWLMKREESSYLDAQGKEVMNFIISYCAYFLGAAILCLILVGFVILAMLSLLAIVLTVVAAVKTSDGKNFRYPFIFRLLK